MVQFSDHVLHRDVVRFDTLKSQASCSSSLMASCSAICKGKRFMQGSLDPRKLRSAVVSTPGAFSKSVTRWPRELKLAIRG